VLTVLQEFFLTLPLLANVYLLFNLGRIVLRALWNWSKRTLMRRIAGALCVTGIISLVVYFWAPQVPFAVGYVQSPARAVQPVQSFKPIDGISCDQGEQSTEHIHVHLTIYVNGQVVTVPQRIGIPPGGNCFYWLHTHLTDGVIHVEAPAQGTYTLGEFSDVWAQSTQTSVLTSTSFLGHPLQGHQLVIWTFTGGRHAHLYFGDPQGLKFYPHEIITIAYDSPHVHPVTHFDWIDSSSGG